VTLIRGQSAIDDCRSHIDSLQRADYQIEAILAAYVCAVIYAELEVAVINCVADRASRGSNDSHVMAWARLSARRIVRSIRVSELAGIAGHFHEDCKVKFHEDLSDEDKAAWDQIVNNRHEIAHEQDGTGNISSMTFAEVEAAFAKVNAVIECFRRSLG
jgi:hypothetical protein